MCIPQFYTNHLDTIHSHIHTPYHIAQISCCDYHSAAVSTIGHLYTFGSKDNGKLGHGRDAPPGANGTVTRVTKFLDSDQTTDMGDIRIGYVSCCVVFVDAYLIVRYRECRIVVGGFMVQEISCDILILFHYHIFVWHECTCSFTIFTSQISAVSRMHVSAMCTLA